MERFFDQIKSRLSQNFTENETDLLIGFIRLMCHFSGCAVIVIIANVIETAAGATMTGLTLLVLAATAVEVACSHWHFFKKCWQSL